MSGLAAKKKKVESFEGALNDITIAIVADYRGLTVEELTALRRELFAQNAKFTVMKNTLLKRAIKGSDKEALSELLKGPTALVYGTDDPIAPVKTLKAFLKKNKKENEVRGGLLDGKLLSRKDLDVLADLPPIEELRAKLLGAIASPANGLVAALSSPQRSLVNVLDQYAKQKQSA